MPKLNPYLNFDGKAEEAFNFINLFSEENSLVRFTKWEMHQVLKTYLKKLKQSNAYRFANRRRFTNGFRYCP